MFSGLSLLPVSVSSLVFARYAFTLYDPIRSEFELIVSFSALSLPSSQVLARGARLSFGLSGPTDIRSLLSPSNAHSMATASVVTGDAVSLHYPDEWDHESSQLPSDYSAVSNSFEPQLLTPQNSQFWRRLCIKIGNGHDLSRAQRCIGVVISERKNRPQAPHATPEWPEVDNTPPSYERLNLIGAALACKVGWFSGIEYTIEVDWW
ncbi:hypothetical protein C8F04DRAFT_1351205 [Mycena alexandri]|uniref:Uncharacterized protein n=1 Tax=Mycena alexandri TaxID=1745969 RepID=A0AAD6TFL4_9AGAR|nr:hypothetical protein C8F04DRAFT_1351205 [Mycena alexandri]